MRLSRPHEKPETSGLRCANTGFARQRRKHVLSDKLPTIPEICEASREDSWRAGPQKLKASRYRNIQRKFTPSKRLPPIPEESEVRCEEILRAEPQNSEHQKVKIHKAKSQQYCQVGYGLEQETHTFTFITHPLKLESLVAIWINHGGSVVVMVLLGALASRFVC